MDQIRRIVAAVTVVLALVTAVAPPGLADRPAETAVLSDALRRPPAVPRSDGSLPVDPLVPLASEPQYGGDGTRPAMDRCQDAAGSWLGMRWREPYRWSYSAASTPGYLSDAGAVSDAVRSAVDNVDYGRNECGIPTDTGVSQRFLGHTTRRANITD